MSEATQLSTVPDAPEASLTKVIRKSGMDPAKAQALMERLTPLVAEAGALVHEARAINVTDASQLGPIKQAGLLHKDLRRVRLAVEKARVELKADALQTGKAIDAAAGWVKMSVEAEEARMLQAAQFVALQEAARIESLRAKREEELRQFRVDTAMYNLGLMSDEQYATVLQAGREQHAAAVAAAVEADRKQKDQDAQQDAENQRIREENEKLRKQAEQNRKDREAAEAQQRREREALEARSRQEREALEQTARQEREAREKLEEQAKLARAEEDRKKKADVRAKRRAANAPDAEKLRALAQNLHDLVMPTMATNDGTAAIQMIGREIEELVESIRLSATQLDNVQ